MKKPKPPARDYILQRLEAMSLVHKGTPVASFTVPARVAPKGNGSQGVTKGGRFARADEAARQRRLGSLLGSQLAAGFGKGDVVDFYVVRLTRFAPREGDDDNVTAAMKPWRDGVASRLGVDDGDAFVRYVVDQERGPYAVRAQLYVKERSE